VGQCERQRATRILIQKIKKNMKNRLFYIGIFGLILFEISNVFFIMPMPGSQEMNSIDVAFFLNKWRWTFRGIFFLMFIWTVKSAFLSQKWLVLPAILAVCGIFYAANFQMAADSMFLQTQNLILKTAAENKIDLDRLVLGIEKGSSARAYPIQFLGYHHQVVDLIENQPIMVTYCTVCRTGRVFSTKIDGKTEQFRLVGMDHFNAMFEDATTKSWWRQATGECIAGARKGLFLTEIPATQTTLEKWLNLFPKSEIMQPDSIFKVEYDSMRVYEKGRFSGKLTRYDSTSWQQKSWIAGIEINGVSKAFDWNRLKKDHILNEMVGNQPVLVVLASDEKSLFAFERTSAEQYFSIQNDTLQEGSKTFDLHGWAANSNGMDLKKINVYQEYWHSWQTFHPRTER
jgi:hypothetical protein